MASQRQRSAPRAATQLVSPPPSGQQSNTAPESSKVGPRCLRGQTEPEELSPSQQSGHVQRTTPAVPATESGMRGLSDRQRRILLESALRHRKQLFEVSGDQKFETVFYTSIMNDFAEEGQRPLPPPTKIKEYLRKLAESKSPAQQLSRLTRRCMRLLLIRDIKRSRTRLMSLLGRLVGDGNLRRNMSATAVDPYDSDALNEAMFSAAFLKMVNRAHQKCSQTGPTRSSSADSSDDSGSEHSEPERPLTPESSMALSSKAQTPISSIENDGDAASSPKDSFELRQLYKLEEVYRAKCIRERNNVDPSLSKEAVHAAAESESGGKPITPCCPPSTARSESGLFVTKSPCTPAITRGSAQRDCWIKSSASALNQQASHLSISSELDCASVSLRATSQRETRDRRRQKEKYRRQDTSHPQTPCPVGGGLEDVPVSAAPPIRATSAVLGCDPNDAEPKNAVIGKAPNSPGSLRCSSEHQVARSPSIDSSSSDDPFSSPLRTTSQNQNAKHAGVKTSIQAPARPANRSTLERENSEFRKTRNKRLICAVKGSEGSALASKPRLDPPRPVPIRGRHTFFDPEVEAAAKSRIQHTEQAKQGPAAPDSPAPKFKTPWLAKDDLGTNMMSSHGSGPRAGPRDVQQYSNQGASTSAQSGDSSPGPRLFLPAPQSSPAQQDNPAKGQHPSSPPAGPRFSSNKGKQPEARRSGPGRDNLRPRKDSFNSSPGPRRSPINRQQRPMIRRWDDQNNRNQAHLSAKNKHGHAQSSADRSTRTDQPFKPPTKPEAMRGETAPPQGRKDAVMRRLDTPFLDALSDEQHDKHISSQIEEMKQGIIALEKKFASRAARKSRGSGGARRRR